MKNVLLITDVDFWYAGAGNRTRINALVKFLSIKVKLTVVYVGPIDRYNRLYITQNYKFDFLPLTDNETLSYKEYGIRLATYIKDIHYDVAIIEYIYNSFFINYLEGCSKIFLDAHDIVSDRNFEFKKFNYTDQILEIPKSQEYQLFEYYDKVIVLVEEDAARIRSIINTEKVMICPHPVSIKPHSVKDKVTTLTFIGSEYIPNKDGINFFIDNVWNEISSNQDIKLAIYGNVCNSLADKCFDERIKLNGYQIDLDEAYDESDIVINPVRFGAGLKIKNIEALANGIPLITTEHGSRGLDKNSNSFLVANHPKQFIDALSRMIYDYELRKNMSVNALNYISNSYTIDKCFGGLLAEIQS